MRHGLFDVLYGNALSTLTELAFCLAGRIAAGGQNVDKGAGLFVQRKGLFIIALRHGLQHGFGIQLQRTGGVAVGRLLVDTAADHLVHHVLGQAVDVVYMGGAPFIDLCHFYTSSEANSSIERLK